MNHEIEFTRFACSRSKFSIFSLKRKKNVSCAGLLQTRLKIRFKEYVIIKHATLKYKLSSY